LELFLKRERLTTKTATITLFAFLIWVSDLFLNHAHFFVLWKTVQGCICLTFFWHGGFGTMWLPAEIRNDGKLISRTPLRYCNTDYNPCGMK